MHGIDHLQDSQVQGWLLLTIKQLTQLILAAVSDDKGGDSRPLQRPSYTQLRQADAALLSNGSIQLHSIRHVWLGPIPAGQAQCCDAGKGSITSV
jgi:hypothetical protein